MYGLYVHGSPMQSPYYYSAISITPLAGVRNAHGTEAEVRV